MLYFHLQWVGCHLEMMPVPGKHILLINSKEKQVVSLNLTTRVGHHQSLYGPVQWSVYVHFRWPKKSLILATYGTPHRITGGSKTKVHAEWFSKVQISSFTTTQCKSQNSSSLQVQYSSYYNNLYEKEKPKRLCKQIVSKTGSLQHYVLSTFFFRHADIIEKGRRFCLSHKSRRIPSRSRTFPQVWPLCESICLTNVYIDWHRAAKFCHDVGGHLPHFTSRAKQEKMQLFLFFNNDREIPPMEAFYVGLRFDNQHKV